MSFGSEKKFTFAPRKCPFALFWCHENSDVIAKVPQSLMTTVIKKKR